MPPLNNFDPVSFVATARALILTEPDRQFKSSLRDVPAKTRVRQHYSPSADNPQGDIIRFIANSLGYDFDGQVGAVADVLLAARAITRREYNRYHLQEDARATAILWLMELQAACDQGEKWSRCVEIADATVAMDWSGGYDKFERV